MKKIKTKDLVFITLMLVVDMILTGPLLATLGMVCMSVGLQVGIAAAFVSAMVYTVMLRKVPVIGVLSVVSIIRGVLAGFMMPGFWPLFPVVALSGIIPDVIAWLFKLNYSSASTTKWLITLNRALITPLMVPLLLATGLLDLSKSVKMITIQGWEPVQIYIMLAFVSVILETILGLFGAIAGNKISAKLIKSGLNG